jgi:hypothetical protein
VRLLEETVKQHEARFIGSDRSRGHVSDDAVHSISSVRTTDLVVTPNTVISLNVKGNTEPQSNGGTTDGMAIALIDEKDSGFFGRWL